MQIVLWHINMAEHAIRILLRERGTLVEVTAHVDMLKILPKTISGIFQTFHVLCSSVYGKKFQLPPMIFPNIFILTG